MVKIEKEKLLLYPRDIKPSSKRFEVLGVLNPGALRLSNGRIVLYVRVIERLKKRQDKKYFYVPRFSGIDKFQIKIDKFPKENIVRWDNIAIEFENGTKRLTTLSHLRRVFLDKDGFRVLKIEQRPGFYGISNNSELGVEDPRIVKIEDKYYMTYVGLSKDEGISTYLAVSENGIKWERKGIIFGEQDKDVVLFPEKIKDKYVAFDRPEGNFEFSTPHIWIAYSKDFLHWGELKAVQLLPKHKDFYRNGAGPPPIKTEKGWLFIFHEVSSQKSSGFLSSIKKFLRIKIKQGPDVYTTWVALLDLNNPEKLIARSQSPIIIPKKKYEISFEGKEVVFPTGIILNENKKDILVYSGAGDVYVTVKKIKLDNILKNLKNA